MGRSCDRRRRCGGLRQVSTCDCGALVASYERLAACGVRKFESRGMGLPGSERDSRFSSSERPRRPRAGDDRAPRRIVCRPRADPGFSYQGFAPGRQHSARIALLITPASDDRYKRGFCPYIYGVRAGVAPITGLAQALGAICLHGSARNRDCYSSKTINRFRNYQLWLLFVR